MVWQINEETYRQQLESEAGAPPPSKPGLQVYYGSLHDILSFPCELKKAAKKRRGGRPSLTTIADELWLEEIFQSLDSIPLIPPSTRTLRDRKSLSSTPSALATTSPQPQRVASSKGVGKELEKATGTGAALERSVSASSSSTSTSTSAAELKPIGVGASGRGSATPTASSSSSKKLPRVILRLGPDPNAKSS